jgi:large-conductance mechanosensitive channel
MAFYLFLFIFCTSKKMKEKERKEKEQKENNNNNNKELLLRAEEIAIKGIKDIYKITTEAILKKET